MAVKKFRPITPTQRYKTVVTDPVLSKEKPLKKLTKGRNRINGRGTSGRITMRRRGGGHKRKFREIDFRRDKLDVPAKVNSIEYDPNRSAYVALLHYVDGEKRYIIAPHGVKPGDTIQSGESARVVPGNALPLKRIPLGTLVHNVELHRGKGGQIVRSAGNYAIVVARDRDYVLLRLPSGEQRNIHQENMATVGRVSNPDHEKLIVGKAGRTRWMGRRPKVRGTVMNPVDHPHGGGEGKTKGGRHPVSPTGLPTKGYRTRKPRKSSSKHIVASRHARRKR